MAIYSWAFLVVLVITGGGCAATTPKNVEEQFNFSNAPNVVFLRSFGSQFDLNPPSKFRQWLFGRDVYGENQGLGKPWGVAAYNGKIYVNDGRVGAGFWELDLATNKLKFIRNRALSGSLGMAVDDRGYKYMAVPRLEEAKSRGTFGTKEEEGFIAVFNERNRLIGKAAIQGRPLDVAVTESKLFVTDGVNKRVLILDKFTLNVIGQFGKQGRGRGEFLFPRGISVGNGGHVFVADHPAGRIQVFDQNGRFVSQYGHRARILGTFINLTGLDADRAGRVYAVDAASYQKILRDEVQVLDSKKFYGAKEEVPSLETKLDKRKNALLGYFQKPYAVGEGGGGLYMPVDVALDYENTKFFQQFAPPGRRFEYLIWLTSNFSANGRDLSVFGFLADE